MPCAASSRRRLQCCLISPGDGSFISRARRGRTHPRSDALQHAAIAHACLGVWADVHMAESLARGHPNRGGMAVTFRLNDDDGNDDSPPSDATNGAHVSRAG
jgi:hypothetical protein